MAASNDLIQMSAAAGRRNMKPYGSSNDVIGDIECKQLFFNKSFVFEIA